jgi:predicted DNA-binding protein
LTETIDFDIPTELYNKLVALAKKRHKTIHRQIEEIVNTKMRELKLKNGNGL